MTATHHTHKKMVCEKHLISGSSWAVRVLDVPAAGSTVLPTSLAFGNSPLAQVASFGAPGQSPPPSRSGTCFMNCHEN